MQDYIQLSLPVAISNTSPFYLAKPHPLWTTGFEIKNITLNKHYNPATFQSKFNLAWIIHFKSSYEFWEFTEFSNLSL